MKAEEDGTWDETPREVNRWLSLLQWKDIELFKPGLYWMIGCFCPEPPVPILETLPNHAFGHMVLGVGCAEVFAWTKSILKDPPAEFRSAYGEAMDWPDWAIPFAAVICRVHNCPRRAACPVVESVRKAMSGKCGADLCVSVRSQDHKTLLSAPAGGIGSKWDGEP